MAPTIVTRPLNHHANPKYPKSSPNEYKKPEAVGPNARDRLAVDAAIPLMVPSTVSEGAALASRMALLGYASVEKVHFHTMMA